MPFIPFVPEYDRDPYKPGKPPFSPSQLDELNKKYESTPQQPGPCKPVADVNNAEEKPAPVAKTEPAPVVPEKKVINGMIFTRRKKQKS
jgi:hypothetical protein